MYVPEGVTAKDLCERNFENWKTPPEKALREAFSKFDLDGNGVIDFEEIKTCMFRYFGIKLSKEESRSMLILYDTDGSGDLCFEEFKCMIQNLESIDPESVSRFWNRTLGWFPPYRLGLWVAKKIGTGKRKRAESGLGCIMLLIGTAMPGAGWCSWAKSHEARSR